MIKDRNQLEHPINLYSQRCSKWVSGTTNDHFVHPDWPQLRGSERLAGPPFDVFGYAFAAAAVLAPFSGFNIVTGIERSKRGKVFQEKMVN